MTRLWAAALTISNTISLFVIYRRKTLKLLTHRVLFAIAFGFSILGVVLLFMY